jgi:hypothetical protein
MQIGEIKGKQEEQKHQKATLLVGGRDNYLLNLKQ